jgi:hypothetical protein
LGRSDIPTAHAALRQFDNFTLQDAYGNDTNGEKECGGHCQIYDDFAVPAKQGLVDNFTLVTQDTGGRLFQDTGGRLGMCDTTNYVAIHHVDKSSFSNNCI